MNFDLDIAVKYPPSNLIYSQEGEDLILHRFFEKKEKGFYVDVGAHHPTRFSNTFIFYLRGWRGINVEPTPGSKKLFDEIRPEDMTLEYAVGKKEVLLFHIFNEGALNTFSVQKAEEVCKIPHYQMLDRIPIEKIPLGLILDKHLPPGKSIDFLNIDAEDIDLEVAESNDWNKYRPTVVLIENHDRKGDIGCAPIRNFMANQNYRFAFRTMNTDFFVDNSTRN